MPLPNGLRPLTESEIRDEIAKGNANAANTLVDADNNLYEKPSFGIGAAARQIGSAIIPLLGGRAIGAGVGALAGAIPATLTGPAAPAVETGATLAGMVGGALGTSALQDYALRKIAEKNPGSMIEKFQTASELDRLAHPYLSQIAALGASPAGGGQIMPNLKVGLKPALKLMGLQGGVSAGTQLAQTGNVDPTTLAISALSGLQTKAPVTSALNPKAFEAQASAKGVDTTTAGLAPNQRPDWEWIRNWWATGDPANMAKVNDPASKAAAVIRKNNIPMSEKDWEDFATLGAARGFDYALKEVQVNKQPQLEGLKPADEAVKAQQAVEPPPLPKSASQSALDIQQGEKDIRAKQLVSMSDEQLKGDAGADAKAVLAARNAGWKVDENAIKSMMIGVPTEALPASVKKVEVAQTPREVPIEKPTPVPEAPETIQAQVAKVSKGITPAALVTPGEVKPKVPPQLKVTPTTQGEVIHEPTVPAQQVKQAAARDKLGPILGHATETQPVGATEAVALVSPGGKEIKASAVTPETKGAEVATLQKQAEPGEKVITTTPEKVAAQRIDAKKGDRVEIEGKVYTISNVSGIKENPTIGWERNARKAIKASDLAKMVAEGRAIHNPEFDAVDIKVFQKLLRGGDKDAMKVIKSLYPHAEDENAHFANLPRGEQESVLREYNKGMGVGEGALSESELKKKVETRSFGIPPEIIPAPIREKFNEAYAKAGINPIEWLRLGLQQGEQRLARSGNPVAQLFVKKAQEMRVMQKQGEEQFQSEALRINKDLSPEEKNTLDKYLVDIERTGKSNVQLNPKLALKANEFSQVMRLLGLDKARPDSPFIQDYDKAGNPISRPFAGPKPGYVMYSMDPKVREVLNNPTKNAETLAKYEQYKDDFIRYNIALRGDTFEQAAKRFDNLVSPAVGPTAPNPEFQANRYAQGVGLPDSMRMNVLDSLSRGITRHFTDMAYHRVIEADPILNRALGLPDNGRNEKIGDVNQNALLVGNPDVKAILRDYVSQTLPDVQQFEKLQRLITAPIISTWSGVRDVLAVPGIFTEIASPSEFKYVLKAAKDAFDPSAHTEAIRAGAARPNRNTGMTVAEDANEFLSKAADDIHKYTGSEAIQQGLRTFNYSLSKQIAHNRVLNGDENFIRKWGPADYQNWDRNALADYIAVRLTGNFSGSYNAEELPNWALRGSGSPLKVIAPLARWSIGRFNRWYENAYEPAKEGNIGPLLRSLGGAIISAGLMNELKEKLTGVKPKEMTWSEFLKLGGKDAAYTLFSKANIAGYGGILTDLAFASTQMGKGERPYGWQNPLFQTIENASERIMQFVDSARRGEADAGDIPRMGLQFLQDQIQVLRMVSQEYQDEGTREEKIARRVGYLPPGSLSTGRPNPLSVGEAYKDQDAERLRQIIQSRLSRGLQPPTPTIAIRQTPNLTVPVTSEEPVEKLAYYKFIADSQGIEAARAAFERDKQLTLQRAQTFQRAVGQQ